MRHRQLFLTALFLVGCDAGGEHHAEGHIEVVMGRIPPVATAHEHGADPAAAAHNAAGEEAHGTAEHAAAPPEGAGEAAPEGAGEAAPEGEVAAEGEELPPEGEAAEAGEGDAEPTEPDPSGEEAEVEAPEPAPEPAPAGGGNADELAKSAKILFGSAKVDGELDVKAVRSTIQKKKGALAQCYAQGLVKNNGLSGKVTLQFNIDKQGKVADASIKSSSLGDATVEACISAEMADWKFDAPADGNKVKVKYPLTFNPS